MFGDSLFKFLLNDNTRYLNTTLKLSLHKKIYFTSFTDCII